MHEPTNGNNPAATRRTRLANERTYLAWWRTGFAALVLSLAIGGLLPAVTTLSPWPLLVLGCGFGLLGVWFIGYGHVRHVAMDSALGRGEYVPLSGRHTSALAVIGVALGVSVIALILYAALR